MNAIVFASRPFVRPDGSHDVSGGARLVFDYLRYEPGGGLYVLSPPSPDGELRDLTADFDGVDISGLDVSFDATDVVFSMRRSGDDHYHIYVGPIDGSVQPRQLTFGPYDDVQPIYVPGDQVAFVTNQPYTALGTRADEYNHARVVAQLAVMSLSEGDASRRLCSQNLSHTVEPFLMSDGTIGYTRWEHLGTVNDGKLFHVNPDCSQMLAVAGQHNKPFNSMVQAAEVEPGVFVGIGTRRDRTIQAGALIRVDTRARGEGSTAVAYNEQTATFDILTPAVPTDNASPPSGVGRYRSPYPLPDGRLLVSWADGDVNTRNELAGTAPNFGIYLWDGNERNKVLLFDRTDMWDLYAKPVIAREIPPLATPVVTGDLSPDRPAVIGSVDIGKTSLEETVSGSELDGMSLSDALLQARRVRVIEGFSTEIGGGFRQFGLTLHDGAAIMGEVPILSDGSWEARVPPYIPYHLQPLDRFGMAIRSQRLWIQAMPGENRRCGGCHMSRVEAALPRTGLPTTLAQQAGPVDLMQPIEDRMEIPWMGSTTATNVQDLFNAKCVSCHSGGASDPYAGMHYTVTLETLEGDMYMYDIPYLDLSDRPLEIYFQMEVVSFPASYVTLLYPSALAVTPEDTMAIGDFPPVWVEPASARTSRLIEVVNNTAEDDPSTWAFDRPAHPEDVGVTLTREERMMLIRSVDLGGQYWNRKNAAGADVIRGY